MVEYKIKLTPGTVKTFVDAATKVEFDIDISSNNHCTVDAKSILGIYGLDLTGVLTVTVNGYDAAFDQFLRGFAVAC